MARTRIEIDGRTAFVSGAASGIGRAIAPRLAGHGCPVAIADQDEAGLGPDAYLFDALARLAPSRYYELFARLEPLAVRAAARRS